ncbi:MAG: IPT/TIG domain-containing protein, partial [Acidobacteria bacterium]|nr:IPT/TIG domain-containing protein [Acidobacteriota bacterium]
MTPWRLLLPEPVEGWLRTAVLALGVIYLPSPLPAVAQTGPEGPTPIFSDDFENGNYFNWSGAQFGAADVEDPEIFLLEPARPAVYNEDRPLIEVGYFDLDAGIEPASFRLTLDGTDLLAACTVAPDTASCPSGPLAVGMHEVRASVWDLAGNRSVGVWSFEVAVDTVAPTLGIRFWDGRGPGQDVIYNDETPVFNLLFEDDLAGVNPTSVTVTVDGSLTVNCSASSDSAFCETPVLAAGSHQIQASIEDYGGNPASAVFDFELFFDDQPPTVSVSLLPAAPRTGEDLAITLSYGDVGLGVDLATVHLEVNGMDRTSLCAVGPTTASCTVTAGNVGGHVLTGHVEDIAGNEARDLLRYRVAAADDAPPVVTLLTPAVGEILTTPDPVLRFSIADDDSSVDPSSVQALLDGLDLTAACSEAAGAFSCPVTGLGRGLHNLQVSASDLAGNAGSAAFSLAVQLSVAVSITQPVEGTLVAGGGAVDVAGTVAAGATSVTVNGFAATL